MRRALLASIVAALLLALVPAASLAAPRPAACTGRCWTPAIDATFAWQLSGTVQPGRAASIYDVDAVETPAATLRRLRALGRRTVCYVSAGSWEEYRADATRYPEEVLGEPLDGWPDERWVDVRRIDLLAPILRARIAACARRGFDGIEFDNVDGYANRSGFELRAADQLRFNRWLANEAHRRGLAVGLKNDPEQVPSLVAWFDFAVVEQCFQYRECARYTPFIRAGKPVFVAEYRLPLAGFCRQARTLRLAAARYPLALDGRRWACPWPVA